MKKILMAAVAAACMFSMSALSFGVRGDVDIGMGKIEKIEKDDGSQTSKPAYEKAPNIFSGSAGAWLDLPILNLAIVSVGLRPEVDVAFNQGSTYEATVNSESGKVEIKKTDLEIPLYLDACFNFSVLRVSAGVGPYVSMPLEFKASEKTLGGEPLKVPSAGWASHTWGVAGYVQAGLKLGPGYLLGDVRLSTPLTKEDLFKAGDTEVAKEKSYKIGVGAGYEFKF
ncbi:MAG: hypothetical protein MJ181_05095 [Treponema sp.]|nr:hypothetical protein [Treponema sp.]